ncbi:MAG: branched-chain amino acid ABC transporter permease [Actinobacteria bacterium]|nr:branched-chain amino acid ABC transporter permease [Actinomycetota bacterium]
MKAIQMTRDKSVTLGLLIVAFLILALLPQFTSGYLVTLLIDILKFAVLTVAWVVFSGPTGYMSLATAAFYGLGFYIAAVFSGTVPFPLLIMLAGASAFVVALGVGALTLRLRGVYFAIFTFALVLLVQNVVLEVERVVTQTRGRFVETVSTEGVYYAILIVFFLTILAAMLIRRSRYGLALQSIGEYEEAAAHSGINVVWTKVLTFATSAVFMGMAGAIIATRRTYIDPYIAFNLNTSFLPVLMAMFGGMGNLVGPVLGAALFTYIGEILLTRFPDLYMLIFGVVLIVSILFMPNGVLGLAQGVWRKMRGGGHAPS